MRQGRHTDKVPSSFSCLVHYFSPSPIPPSPLQIVINSDVVQGIIGGKPLAEGVPLPLLPHVTLEKHGTLQQELATIRAP
jgi:hypothetical protein